MTLFAPRSNLILSALLLVTLLTSLIVLGIDGDLVRRAGGDAGGAWAFNIFLVVWTWLSVVPLLALAAHRPDSVLLQTRFVLANVGLLWIFWLAAAAATTDDSNWFLSSCGERRSVYLGYYRTGCSQHRALLAFLWITWLLVTAILGGLVALAYREASRRGKDVWSTSIYDHAYLCSGAPGEHKTGSGAEPVQGEMANANTEAASQPAMATTPAVAIPASAQTSAA